MLYLPSQHELGILQGLVVEQPIQFCPLCRGVAVFVLNGYAVDGKSDFILEPGFQPVGVHVVAAGNSNQCRQAGGGYIASDCAKLQWELTIVRVVSDFDIEHRQFGNKYIVQYREFSIEVSHPIDLQRKMRYNKIEVITMEKTMTLNLRVNPTVKQQAEDVLKQLGIPMATAIDMYLRQITLTGGIPFSLSLPKAPAALNADTMTDDQLHAALQVGIKEIQNGDTVDAASAFAQFREQHR